MEPKFQVKWKIVMKWLPNPLPRSCNVLYDVEEDAQSELNRLWTGIMCPGSVLPVLVCEMDGIFFEVTDKVRVGNVVKLHPEAERAEDMQTLSRIAQKYHLRAVDEMGNTVNLPPVEDDD